MLRCHDDAVSGRPQRRGQTGRGGVSGPSHFRLSRETQADLQHEGNLRHHLKHVGIPCEGSPSDWVTNGEIKRYILEAMLETAKIGGLNKVEMIKDVILTPEEWFVGA
jgi:hypothetical protein